MQGTASQRDALCGIKPPVCLLHSPENVRLAQALAAVHASQGTPGSRGEVSLLCGSYEYGHV